MTYPKDSYFVDVKVPSIFGRQPADWVGELYDWCNQHVGQYGRVGWRWPWDRWMKKPTTIVDGAWMIFIMANPEISDLHVRLVFKKKQDAMFFKLTWYDS